MKKGLKNISVAISIVATTALLLGCGGTNSSESITTISQNSFTPTKIDRAWYDGVNSDDSNADISLVLEEPNTYLSIRNLDANNFTNNQFFINSDGDTYTGNEVFDGADYLIENTHIFRSTGRGWSWKYVGEVDSLNRSDDHRSVEVEFINDYIANVGSYTTVISIQRDANWKTLQVTKKTIYPDRIYSNIRSNDIVVSFDKEFLGAIEYNHVQMFINSDRNIDTGYARYDGADYLIEDGKLYKSTGRGWSWQYIKELKHYRGFDTANSIIFHVVEYQKGDFGDENIESSHMIAVANDENWNVKEVVTYN